MPITDAHKVHVFSTFFRTSSMKNKNKDFTNSLFYYPKTLVEVFIHHSSLVKWRGFFRNK